ncbi:Fic family protein [Patescibacteria group bacterium]|nr:Fic family protein [Patescibacteria group bacterium]
MVVTSKHSKITLFEPDFGSSLTDLIIELDYLRKKPLGGTTHPVIFFQLKNIFHMLESIGSSRIEGNHTTVAEYIETKIEGKKSKNEKDIEIQNLEKAMEFIDKNVKKYKVNRIFLSELHKQVVKDLTSPPSGEGSVDPGQYRAKNCEIVKSKHIPPDFTQVDDYMKEFFNFINKESAAKYDLLKVAVSYHRFAWIHPFDNGNGRTVRLLTYAMLVKQGFNVNVGRILNPTAIFCIDRKKYYDALSWADRGTKKGELEWCEYVLSGLKKEIEKIDKLSDYEYLANKILIPMISYSLDRKTITDLESKILRIAVEKQVFMSSDIKTLMPNKVYTERSRVLRKLKNKKMIAPEKGKSRKYTLRFDNNYLLRGVIDALEKEGFIPIRN